MSKGIDLELRTTVFDGLDVDGTVKSTALSGSWDKSSDGHVIIGQLLIAWGQTTVGCCKFQRVPFPEPYFNGTDYSFFAMKHNHETGGIITTKKDGKTGKETTEVIEGKEGLIFQNNKSTQDVSWLAIGRKKQILYCQSQIVFNRKDVPYFLG